MKMTDPGALQDDKDRVRITAHICWGFGRVLEFRGVCTLGLCEVILIYRV